MMAVNVVEAAASNIRAARAHASQIRAGLASLAADIRAAESDPALLGYDSWHEYAVDLFGVDKAEVLSIVRERCCSLGTSWSRSSLTSRVQSQRQREGVVLATTDS